MTQYLKIKACLEKIYIVLSNYDNYIGTPDYGPQAINLRKSEIKQNYSELFELEKFLDNLNKELKQNIICRPHISNMRRHSTISFENKYENEIHIDTNFKIPLMHQLKILE